MWGPTLAFIIITVRCCRCTACFIVSECHCRRSKAHLYDLLDQCLRLQSGIPSFFQKASSSPLFFISSWTRARVNGYCDNLVWWFFDSRSSSRDTALFSSAQPTTTATDPPGARNHALRCHSGLMSKRLSSVNNSSSVDRMRCLSKARKKIRNSLMRQRMRISVRIRTGATMHIVICATY